MGVETEGIRHNCGIAGIYVTNGEESVLNLPGLMASVLYTLQPRGQEGAGMYLENTTETYLRKDSGWAKTIFKETEIERMRLIYPHIAIGHDRYSTSGKMDAWQPLYDDNCAFVHNGNLTNAAKLLNELPAHIRDQALSDSWIAHQLIIRADGNTMTEKIQNSVVQFEGAYNIILAAKGKIFAVRDPWGFRPLIIGSLANNQGYIVASETSALAPIGARFIREVHEGEGVVIDENGIQTFFVDPRTDPEKIAHCIFEFIYISSPDSVIFNQPVAKIRYELGRKLARADIAQNFLPDVIVGVQQSGVLYAQGYSEEYVGAVIDHPESFGIPHDQISTTARSLVLKTGLVANPYAGRVFISPDRDDATYTKHRANAQDVSGKIVVNVDDSVLRSLAGRALNKAEREHPLAINMPPPKEVHLRIASPPIAHPCFMGVDFATKEQLIAYQTNGDIEEIGRRIGVDSLKYLSHRDLVTSVVGEEKAAAISDEQLYEQTGHCGACFTGNYPIYINGTYGK
ncbi:TPA: hypothetical protein DIV55_07365 [Patescibacteria group bacterium]|nr:hypothetical protein [Patescibacteria group bacterium]